MDKYLQRFVLMLEADTNYKAIRLVHLMRSSISTMVYILLSLTIIVVLTCIRAMADQHTFPTKRDDIGAKQIARVVNVTVPSIQFMNAEAFESRSGGAATSLKHVNRNSFSHPSANLTFAERGDFNLGDGLFRKLWTSSPSSTQASDGLGPLYNARGCQSCHIKDGRGQPPEKGVDSNSMFLRLARNPSTAEEISAIENHRILNFPDPVYGGQLQNFAVPSLVAEGKMKIEYTDFPVKLGDGSIVNLRKPSYFVEDLGFGPLHVDTTLSPRVTPPMIGMGLIQAIHPADIIGIADPEDLDEDGISGRIAIVRDPDDGKLVLGRFGWKAQNPTIRAQSAGAFSGDVGISNPDAPNNYGDCTKKQPACLAMPNGEQTRLGATEAPDPVLELVTFYSENLAVPARRDVSEPQVLAGKQLFYELGCISCHRPKFVTSKNANNKAHRFQLIWPYSDFLLHDMGEDLADGQQVGIASGREWRTQPLWGIGLTKIVSGHTFFLHDGRARNLGEAILWHDGEAKNARDGFASLEKKSRNALLKFLESL
jgi:CxxC motif-containing protein (DUF1111 family)